MTLLMASLSIAARVTLNTHSLNNERIEGNDTQTRMVHIVGADARLYHVSAISGDMLKHIQCQHFFNIARQTGLPLCAGCTLFDANRINADQAWISTIPTTDREAVSALLQHCALDDVAGILITAGGPTGKRAVRRDSVSEFAWGVGIPSLVQSEQHFHVKYASELHREQIRAHASAREKEGSNLGQAIFYQPASSGIYALSCHLELGRVGYNDISQSYAVDRTQRMDRTKALLHSVLYTFLELNGAMRNTHLPHFVAMEGIITVSQRGDIPAPLISPLAGGMENPKLYIEQTQTIAKVLCKQDQAAIHCAPFEAVSDFAVKMDELIDRVVPDSSMQSGDIRDD